MQQNDKLLKTILLALNNPQSVKTMIVTMIVTITSLTVFTWLKYLWTLYFGTHTLVYFLAQTLEDVITQCLFVLRGG